MKSGLLPHILGVIDGLTRPFPSISRGDTSFGRKRAMPRIFVARICRQGVLLLSELGPPPPYRCQHEHDKGPSYPLVYETNPLVYLVVSSCNVGGMRNQLTSTGKRRDTLARKARASHTLSVPAGGHATWPISGKRKPDRNNAVSRQGGAGPLHTDHVRYVGVSQFSRRRTERVAINRVDRRRAADAFAARIEAELQARRAAE